MRAIAKRKQREIRTEMQIQFAANGRPIELPPEEGDPVEDPLSPEDQDFMARSMREAQDRKRKEFARG